MNSRIFTAASLLVLLAFLGRNRVQAIEISGEPIVAQPPGSVSQEQAIKIHPIPEATTSLAIVRYAPKGEANSDTEAALPAFNNFLWADLKFPALFRVP